MNSHDKLKKISSILIGVYILLRFDLLTVHAYQKSNPVLFSNVNHAEMIPLYIIIVIVGGCIAVTLTYVSWRKYRAEKNKQTNKDSDS